MSSIGPDLPPHLLAKRKREAEEGQESSAQPSTTAEEAPKSPDGAEKRRRVMGPAPPPAPLDELPPTSAQDEEDSSSDDDYGPSVPTEKPSATYYDDDDSDGDQLKDEKPAETKLQRDEWMMMPPTQDGLAARMDPTKIRPGKFRSGKSAGGPKGDGIDSIWTETPEQKRKRLENEVLGIQTAAASSAGSSKKKSKADEEAGRKIREYNEKHRGKSLYEEHQKSKPLEKEDDPSARPFDREKDVAGGMKIGHSQRKQMLDRSKDFGSRFSKGTYQ